MRAKRKDGNQRDIEEALTKAGYYWFDTHDLGNGFPDMVAVSKSCVTVLFEVKMPGEKLTPAEIRFFENFTGALYIVNCADQALKILSKYDAGVVYNTLADAFGI